MHGYQLWGKRIGRAIGYICSRDWAGLRRAVREFLIWKGLLRSSLRETHENFLPRIRSDLSKESLDPSQLFEMFLAFELTVFGRELPIPAYDPYLIRYGEYRFALEELAPRPGEVVVDLGCGVNILGFFLAYLGARVIGVDIDLQVSRDFYARKELVEETTGNTLEIELVIADATRLSLAPNSVDKVVAISSIEHMFSADDDGDRLAIGSVALVLKPGGIAVITLPMSGEKGFHESSTGDACFGGPYRLYTPEALKERILARPELEVKRWNYLAYTTPAPYDDSCFYQFWLKYLTPDERWKWAWANPILASVFNPIVAQEEGEKRLAAVNTALICLRKKYPRGTEDV